MIPPGVRLCVQIEGDYRSQAAAERSNEKGNSIFQHIVSVRQVKGCVLSGMFNTLKNPKNPEKNPQMRLL